MKKYFRISGCMAIMLFLVLHAFGQSAPATYRYKVDLTNVVMDKVKVLLEVEGLSQDTLQFCFPRVVPGTYSVSEFSRFISGLSAQDAKGNSLPMEQIPGQGWQITKGKSLAKITYWVEDTWDTKQKNIIFEPGGTNIEANENFVINPFGFFGFFRGMEKQGFEITFIRPEAFFGSTALVPVATTENQDSYWAEDYHKLVDSPIMFNVPDTTKLNVGGAEVLVSVYSPNKKLSSKYVAENIAEILEAQKAYLGGQLPIDNYAFIIYLSDKPSLSGLMGALEHSYSSFYHLPEIDPVFLTKSIRDIAAHEFFHIVTPLSIHSEEIHNFDFIEPAMSRHLWLYEGVVEYFSFHVQAKHGLISLEDFFETIKEKIENAATYKKDVSFTEMSLGCLDTYQDEYGNVYEKGALIGLALDLQLLSLSEGAYGLQQLITDLSRFYGKQHPFKDEELFDKITEIAKMPALREFFTKYVEGTTPLPLSELLLEAGVLYSPEKRVTGASLGVDGFGVNDQGQVLVAALEEGTPVHKQLKAGDVVYAIDGEKITMDNAVEIIQDLRQRLVVGNTVQLTLLKGKKNKQKTIEVAVREVSAIQQQVFEPVTSPSEQQKQILRAWLAP